MDIVIGSSMGGQIVQYLAANHPDCAETFVALAAACDVTEESKDLVRHQAAVVANGDHTQRGLAATEQMLPGRRLGWLRRLLVPLAARTWDWQTDPSEHEHVEHDYAIESDAVIRFNAREALPRIRAPVLLINGDRDRSYPKELVEETAQLIPDCTLVWCPGKGHDATCDSRRLGPVILDYISKRSAPANASWARAACPGSHETRDPACSARLVVPRVAQQAATGRSRQGRCRARSTPVLQVVRRWGHG